MSFRVKHVIVQGDAGFIHKCEVEVLQRFSQEKAKRRYHVVNESAGYASVITTLSHSVAHTFPENQLWEVEHYPHR